MSFKLRSQIVIYASEVGIPPIEHLILRRDRILRPGDIIHTKGSVATDVEGKGLWASADVVIRIIDEEELGITWKRELRSKLSRWLFDEEEKGYFDPERIIEGKTPLNLDDAYHQVWKYKLPETFTPLDRIRIPILEGKKLIELEGLKDVRRETDIVYEPTLLTQARR